jgi:asparagine synthetase B (glutamine-hydrolysing)
MNLKNVLTKVVSEQLPPNTKKVAMLLSGGVDSFTVASTLQHLGVDFHAYTFRIDNVDTKDVLTAANTAKKFNWEWSTVEISSSNLEQDFLILANTWGCKKKTEFECTWPFIHLFPNIQESVMLTGTTADTLYGSSKKVALHYSRPKEVFDQYRRESLSKFNIEGYRQLESLAKAYNKHIILPYRHPEVQEFFMGHSYDELHKPTRKAVAKQAFSEEFSKVEKINSRNLQLAAGIPEIFERLLQSPLNVNKRRRVMDLCKDYAQQ